MEISTQYPQECLVHQNSMEICFLVQPCPKCCYTTCYINLRRQVELKNITICRKCGHNLIIPQDMRNNKKLLTRFSAKRKSRKFFIRFFHFIKNKFMTIIKLCC